MHRLGRASAVAALCLAVSTLAFGQKTKFEFDRSEDFSALHTYKWAPSTTPAKGVWNDRIIAQIDQQLSAKGLRKVDSDPDVLVIYATELQKQDAMMGGGYVFGPGWTSGRAGVPSTETAFTTGTLVIAMADPKTRQIIWRGTANNAISSKTDKNIETVDKAVAKLLKDYPPKSKK
jgi:hypothetical protein